MHLALKIQLTERQVLQSMEKLLSFSFFSVKLENTSQIKDQSTEIGQQDLSKKKSYSGFRHIFSTHNIDIKRQKASGV
jgi:hypothetical protein